jgi:hypothetical protein
LGTAGFWSTAAAAEAAAVTVDDEDALGASIFLAATGVVLLGVTTLTLGAAGLLVAIGGDDLGSEFDVCLRREANGTFNSDSSLSDESLSDESLSDESLLLLLLEISPVVSITNSLNSLLCEKNKK